MKKQMTLVLAALTLSAFASAQEAPVRYMPEPDFDALIGRAIDDVRPHDAFEGVAACKVVDSKFFQPVEMAQAQKLLLPCVKAVSTVYNAKVGVKEGTLPAPEGRMSAQVEVLMLEVPAGTGATSPVMRDLNRAIAVRGGRLLGHPAVVVPAEQRKTPQQALDECVLPMVLRDVENGDDFIRSYGGCLRRVAEFAIVEMKPWPNKPLGVIVLTKADNPVAESLTTEVQVDSLNGKVKIDLVAYPTPTVLK